MKVITLHTVHAVQSKNYNNTFNHGKHSIVFSAELNGFLIDKAVFIPMHCVREVVIEPFVELSCQTYGQLTHGVVNTTLEYKEHTAKPRARRADILADKVIVKHADALERLKTND